MVEGNITRKLCPLPNLIIQHEIFTDYPTDLQNHLKITAYFIKIVSIEFIIGYLTLN